MGDVETSCMSTGDTAFACDGEGRPAEQEGVLPGPAHGEHRPTHRTRAGGSNSVCARAGDGRSRTLCGHHIRYARERTACLHRQLTSSCVPAVILSSSIACYLLGRRLPAPPPTTSTLPLSETTPPKHDVSKATVHAAWADFVDIVGRENVSTEATDIEGHSGSGWSTYSASPGERPFMVVYPSTTDEVSGVARVCHERRIPMTAYSGGTSLEGHYAVTRGGICVDFGRMDNIVALHKEDLDVVVQPAVGWEALNEKLAHDNLFFPPDPGPGAMIGGMVGTGCSGTNAYRYGTMKDWVVSLTVVLADGTVVKTRQRPRKSSAGYDLTRIFIGSEGTLGLVTEATLRVTVRPKSQSVAVASFGTIRDAAECVARVVGEGIPIAAVEVLDDVQMKCINAAGSTSRKWKEAPTLFFKFAGTPTGVKEQISAVQKQARAQGSRSFEFARNNEEASELWSARKDALWSVMGMRRSETDRVWSTDVAVPISRLPDIIEETKDDMQRSGLLAAIVGHVGDGNFHGMNCHARYVSCHCISFMSSMARRPPKSFFSSSPGATALTDPSLSIA